MQSLKLIPEFSSISYNFDDASHFLGGDINMYLCIPKMKCIALTLSG